MNKEFEIKVKLSIDPKDAKKLKEDLSKVILEEAGPEIQKFAKNLLLFKEQGTPINQAVQTGGEIEFGMDWGTFYSSKAGIIAKGILRQIDKSKIKRGIVSVNKLANAPGQEVFIQMATTDAANKVFDQSKLDEEQILDSVTKLDPSSVEKLFTEANEALKS